MKKNLKIMVLYPKEMNIYGDHGNLLALKYRAKLHGFDVREVMYEPGIKFDSKADIIIGGGGQDSGQGLIKDDLVRIGPKLRKMADSGAPMLMICGLYQLFGHYFLTQSGEKLPGIGVFDAYTEASPKRLIGNTVTESDELGVLIGYENHSGLTHLNPGQSALARVKKGAGNNGRDGTEGARVNNVFGSYLHGPILPKNPRLADELIRLATIRKYGEFSLDSRINDKVAEKARHTARRRPR